MEKGNVWEWWIALSATAGFMTLVVRLVARKEHWVVSSWVIVYLGCSLAVGAIWALAFR